MKRRTDRAIAIAAVTAVAVVPTAIVMAVQVGGGSEGDRGSSPASAAMAQGDPADPNGTATGVVTPGASAAPGAGRAHRARAPVPGRLAGPREAPSPTCPRRRRSRGRNLHAFTRKTDVKVTIGSDGDYKHATETAL